MPKPTAKPSSTSSSRSSAATPHDRGSDLMDIPGPEDFADAVTLDEIYARGEFLGKSFDEAVEMFADNSLAHTESLSHMAEKAALFYGAALLHYVNSPESRDDVDAASALVAALDSWLESRFDLGAIESDLRLALQRILEQFSFYAPDQLTQRVCHQLPKHASRVLRRLTERVRA